MFLYILADAENSGSTSHVLTSFYYFLRLKKQKAGFGLLSEGTEEKKVENEGKLTDLENGYLGSEVWGL